ncbi:methyl-accepting chemotaxis protein [Erwiniaceae bacterium BAC15a-03b]|uniref:Methyl-accepting chemotaxis protein n=1 Tax=Winslowiella arboricola TaxID=2978220 RepID=A0A9J6PMY7_9GAMM|nr:methyl-accepting chemotaxis protein [Winslowiella arboricola]MCU5775477.1 methyl-accepting chemotaxis protein [Winslowiella arboricola]MCU5779673.1 methyl-accepting chemotaxis protein [Winslowiella arboricola]
MTITKRLFLIFTLLALSLCTLTAVSLYVITGFQDRFEYVQANAIPSIKDLNKSISTSNQLRVAIYEHKGTADNGMQADIEKRITDLIGQLKSLTEYYMAHDISSDLDKTMTEDAFKNIAAVEAALPNFIAASRAHDDVASLDTIKSDNGVGAAVRKTVDEFNRQIQLNIDIGDELRKQNAAIYSSVFWSMLAAAVLVILLVGALAFRTIFNVRNSLNSIQRVMENASETLDLTLLANTARQDEIGKTAAAFNHLTSRVSGVLAAVTSSAQSVSSASTQIAAGNEDLSARTEEQAASLEQTSASMSTLNDTVKLNAENARQASMLASSANELALSSGNSVAAMVGTMENIRSSSAKISDITGLIEGIAFQTNILALNAAVEAARAGEQGRGFAVVASEVRNLAQRSSTAAKEIKDLIITSSQLVASGSVQAADVGENMSKVQGSIRQVADIVGEMAAATAEQSQGIEQVHLAVGQMDSVTQQNAALVEEASAASQSLQEQAATLSNLVSAFKVQGDSAVTRPAAVVSTAKLAPKKNLVLADSGENWSSF